MTSILDGQPLCHRCQTLTFVSLRDGFTHPMMYNDIVISGKRCPLCRLIVCTMGKLQNNKTCYEIEKRYDSEIEELVHLPAVYRRQTRFPLFPLLDQLIKPRHINWTTEEYRDDVLEHEVRKGNFEGGETIQVTAAKDSIYRASGLVPLDKIMPASTEQNFDLLRDWLKCCLSTHESCRAGNKCTDENAILPTRVIDVGSSRENDIRPYLLETKGGLKGTYMTLSHRWGSTESQFKTESSTLKRFQRELPMELMPQSFRDAIKVTRQLDIRYLWIDSLCIVQDDPSDWKRESLKMGTIFASCICTIAATDALNQDGRDCGLFLPRDDDPLAIDLCLPYNKTPLKELSRKCFKGDCQCFVWKYKWLAQPNSSIEEEGLIQKRASICLRPRIVSLTARIRRSIWYNRGWVLQERLLSPRIIYFTKDKIFWSCFRMAKEEENSDPTAPHRIYIFSPHVREGGFLFDLWKSILLDYVRCNLTFGKDRLAAIDGITRQFEEYHSVKIYAGILHDATGESLLWYTNKKPLQRFLDFHAPSWSWTSLAGCVSFSLQSPLNGEYKCLIGDLAYDTTAACPLRTPQRVCGDTCISGSVSFTGPMGKLRRSILVRDVNEEFQHDPIKKGIIMTGLLGSTMKHSLRIPRVDEDWKMLPDRRPLSVPDHTELLECDEGCGTILGFFIPDVERPCKAYKSVLCAGIKEWEGDMQIENSEVDFIGLEEIEQSPRLYHRIGRGRIICNGWSSKCKRRRITII